MKRSRVNCETQLEDFTIEKQIGEGGFANIYLASTESGNKYALKKVLRGREKKENIEREVQAGLKLKHPNIAQFIGHFEDEKNDTLVFEYIRGTAINIFYLL